MVRTASTMLALGTPAPEFSLPEVTSGKIVNLQTLAGKKALVVMFICRHCPYVKYIEQELARIGRDYADKSVGIVAISANDVATHPDDRPESLAEQARLLGFNFPYCYDETQQVARAYTAACTPDFFVFDAQRRLVYRGQLDDARPHGDQPVTGKDLRAAIEAVLADRPVSSDQRASLGCNIKWQPGAEPSYFTGVPAT